MHECSRCRVSWPSSRLDASRPELGRRHGIRRSSILESWWRRHECVAGLLRREVGVVECGRLDLRNSLSRRSRESLEPDIRKVIFGMSGLLQLTINPELGCVFRDINLYLGDSTFRQATYYASPCFFHRIGQQVTLEYYYFRYRARGGFPRAAVCRRYRKCDKGRIGIGPSGFPHLVIPVG
jgi:hypothetical protein